MASQIMLVIGAALLQATGIFSFWETAPNFVLIVLLPLIFFVSDWWRYLLLVLIGGMLLLIQPLKQLADWPTFILMVALLAAYGSKKYLPWRPLFSVFILLIIITALADWSIILPQTVVFNVVLGMATYLIFKKWLPNPT